MGLKAALPAVAAAALAAGLAVPRLLRRPSSPPPSYGSVPDFRLIDAAGKPVALEDLKGRPWVASFLFTRCSGQCPMMAATLKTLAKRAPGLRFVSFSLDPSDTPAALSRFARAYGAGWTFLTGGPGVVQRLSREGFKLPAAEGGAADEPIVHSSKLVLVDAAGAIRGYFDALDDAQADALARLALSL